MRAEMLRKNDRIRWFICAGTSGWPSWLVRNVFATIDLDGALPTFSGWPPGSTPAVRSGRQTSGRDHGRPRRPRSPQWLEGGHPLPKAMAE
jgi:hypothetical protein